MSAATLPTSTPTVACAAKVASARAAHAAPDRVLSTLNRDGSRRWINPKPSSGRFARQRRAVAIALILIFALIPYIPIAGKPAILLDLAARRFTLFGVTFLPTDTLLLALLMVSIFVGIFLVTALLGRVWCGWACPQTVYMEFVFRPIERLFVGPAGHGGKSGFRGSPLASALKHVTFLAISCFLAHTFLAYFVGVEALEQWVRRSPFDHPASFLVMAATTVLMMFNFGYFREQTCILACPYGRFQSVMLDRQSLIISYDVARGEPRGKKQRVPLTILASDHAERTEQTNAAVASGDCIDCRMCVTTCPTGIDIREGLQMECVGCAQCIDACDDVMTRIGRPLGLIRYSSQAAMAGETAHIIRPRVIIYPLILLALSVAFIFLLTHRAPADVTVLRGLGKPFVELADGMIGNQVRIKIINRTDNTVEYRVTASGIEGVRFECDEPVIRILPGESRTVPAVLAAPVERFAHGNCRVQLHIDDGPAASFAIDVPYQMLGPGSREVHKEHGEHLIPPDSRHPEDKEDSQ